MYSGKELLHTLKGEGTHVGRPAVFCRFAGCHLWSGREEDRATARWCFCDTEFVGTDGDGGGKFETAAELPSAAAARWPHGANEVAGLGVPTLENLCAYLWREFEREDCLPCRVVVRREAAGDSCALER